MVFPVHTVKACGGMESIAAHIFGTRWGQSADASHGGKHVQYPLNKWLVGRSPGLYASEKRQFSYPSLESNCDSSVIQSVA